MGARVSIGDFAVMAHLSRKALRHYHELGILEPAHVDAATGYRYYDTSQVDQAQLIRRLRSLEMSIPDIKAFMSADDVASRNTVVANHLRRMEEQLHRTTNAVAELRELLEPTGSHPRVELRHESAAAVWSVTAVVDSADIDRWFTASVHQLEGALTTSRTQPDGPLGGVYDRELFGEDRGRATLYVPVTAFISPPATVHAETLPPAEVAVLTHTRSHSEIDRSYGALGAYVHEHLISREGPIREHYVGAPLSNLTHYTATEICWPIFNTGASPSL
jgi:DNA-binding transcriptional MerR regulator